MILLETILAPIGSTVKGVALLLEAKKYIDIGNRIRQLRGHFGSTQACFAEKCGINRGYLAVLEVGKKKPSSNALTLLIEATGVSSNWLLTGEGSMFPENNNGDDQDQLGREIIGEDLYAARVMMSHIPKGKLTDDKVDEIAKLLVGLDEQGIEAVLAAARQADRIVQLEKKHAG